MPSLLRRVVILVAALAAAAVWTTAAITIRTRRRRRAILTPPPLSSSSRRGSSLFAARRGWGGDPRRPSHPPQDPWHGRRRRTAWRHFSMGASPSSSAAASASHWMQQQEDDDDTACCNTTIMDRREMTPTIINNKEGEHKQETTTTTTAANITTTTVTTRVHYLANVHRIYCISDLHVEHAENWHWIHDQVHYHQQQQQPPAGSDALLIVAGDVSHDLTKLEATFRLLFQTFAYIVYVPGNHEAWLTPSECEQRNTHITTSSSTTSQSSSSSSSSSTVNNFTSLDKLAHITQLCQQLGVLTTGSCVGIPTTTQATTKGNENTTKTETEMVWILPFDGWYDGSLSIVPLPLPQEAAAVAAEAEAEGATITTTTTTNTPTYDHLVQDFLKWPWVDFQRCRWPTQFFTAPRATSSTPATGGAPAPRRSRLLKNIPGGLIDYFLAKNQRSIKTLYREEVKQDHTPSHTTVITVTHFLPNQQCLPDWMDIPSSSSKNNTMNTTATPQFEVEQWLTHGLPGLSAKFALVAGAQQLDDQIRAIHLRPETPLQGTTTNPPATASSRRRQHIHVFGHSHRPKDFVYQDVRYVHHPLGKPQEREMSMIDPNLAFKLLWEQPKRKTNNEDDQDTNTNTNTNTNSIHDVEETELPSLLPLTTTPPTPPLLRYWEQYGGGVEMLRTRMAEQRQLRQNRRKRNKETKN